MKPSLLALLILLAPAPALAWQFEAAPLCAIWHDTGEVEMRVSYDPRSDQPYALALTLAEGAWPEGGPFALRFEGGRGMVLTTDRHRLEADAGRLVVEDRGFGNVLAGLSSARFARPLQGGKSVDVPLKGAAAAVEAFKACSIPSLS